MEEIERKFFVKKMPSAFTKATADKQERYFLELGKGEKRITRIDNKYFYEEKGVNSGLSAEKVIKKISKEEFETLKIKSIKSLNRKSYILSQNPEVSIKVYGGNYEGLIRAEYEFETEKEAKEFVPPEWVGMEITETELGRDGRLVNLSRNEFLKLLQKVD